MIRTALLSVVVSVVAALIPRPAKACSVVAPPPPPCTAARVLTPLDAPLPANTLELRVAPGRPPAAEDAQPVEFLLTDDQGAEVARYAPPASTGGGHFTIRPAELLLPGTQYTLHYEEWCGEDDQPLAAAKPVEWTFEVGPEAAIPETAGMLSVSPVRTVTVERWSMEADCSQKMEKVRVAQADVTLRANPLLEPHRAVATYAFTGVNYSRDGRGLPGTETVEVPCAKTPWTDTVRLNVRLGARSIPAEPATLVLTCEPEPPTDSAGCTAVPSSSAALPLLLMLVGALGGARRRVEGSRRG